MTILAKTNHTTFLFVIIEGSKIHDSIVDKGTPSPPAGFAPLAALSPRAGEGGRQAG